MTPHSSGSDICHTFVFCFNNFYILISNVTINVLSKVITFLRSARPESETEVQEEDLLNDCLGLYVAVADLKKLV